MLEKLKAKRDVLVNELDNVKNKDLTALIAERVELYKAKAIEEVNQEHEAEINEVKEKINHYDFVIEALEADEEEPAVNEVVEA